MRRLAAACSALLLTVGLAACSSDTDSADSAAALEEYVETMQAEVPTFLESFTMYSDFRIEADPPSTLVYEYDFTDEVPRGEAGDTYMDRMRPTLQTMADTQLFPEMREHGIADPRVRFRYFDRDGEEIWSVLITPS